MGNNDTENYVCRCLEKFPENKDPVYAVKLVLVERVSHWCMNLTLYLFWIEVFCDVVYVFIVNVKLIVHFR